MSRQPLPLHRPASQLAAVTTAAATPATVPAPVVVFAVGNPSRGDDALGPYLLEQLQHWLASQPGLAGQVELIEDFQLNIEHALDLQGRQLAIFIDAGDHTPAPYTYTPVTAAADLGSSTHALEPGAVLRVFVQTVNANPPPAYVLCVRGEAFELGQPLSAAASAHADAAFDHLTCTLSRAVLQPAPAYAALRP